MHVHESHIAVRYAETDAMGVVHHASYIVWYEVGRTEWLQALNYSYAEFERSGFYLVVAEIGARYVRPIRYGDPVLLRTRVGELKSRSIRFDYEVEHPESGEMYANGFSRHILTDHQGAIRKWPEAMWQILMREPGTS